MSGPRWWAQGGPTVRQWRRGAAGGKVANLRIRSGRLPSLLGLLGLLGRLAVPCAAVPRRTSGGARTTVNWPRGRVGEVDGEFAQRRPVAGENCSLWGLGGILRVSCRPPLTHDRGIGLVGGLVALLARQVDDGQRVVLARERGDAL